MVNAPDTRPDSDGDMAHTPGADMYVASLLASFFEAGWAVQVLVGDANQAQYEASRIARPESEKHLCNMAEIAKTLPENVRDLMPAVDWESWNELGEHVPPKDARDRALIWAAIDAWLPPAGLAMRRYRRQMPELWRFKM